MGQFGKKRMSKKFLLLNHGMISTHHKGYDAHALIGEIKKSNSIKNIRKKYFAMNSVKNVVDHGTLKNVLYHGR